MRPSHISSNLKQKLSTLSRSQSSPSTPSSPTSAKSKFKNAITSAWRRHGPNQDIPAQLNYDDAYGRDRLQEAISKLVFQAGVDFETRPMIVVAACALPDPEQVSYDQLLANILSYFDLYVESDYTVVFLAAGGQHTPSWNWVWKVYRSQLSRKYRKNLKRLYVVHPSFFSKMLLSLAGAIISPKFYQKIQYCSTLSQLAQHVPLTQIDIPPAVYEENLKHEDGITLPIQPLSSHFGVPIEELMGAYGEKGGVPRVVRDCVLYLRKRGMEEVGLFRRSTSTVTLKQVKAAYDRGHPVNLDTYHDVHLPAVLLKMFFRDLPTPIIPEDCYTVIRRCPFPSAEDGGIACITYIRENVLPALGSYASVILLSYVLHLLHDVSLRANTNKMDAYNLAVVFTPNLIKSSNPVRDVQMCTIPGTSSSNATTSISKDSRAPTVATIIKWCIERYFEIFDEVEDRTEAVPRSNSALSEPSEQVSDNENSEDTALVMPVRPSSSPRVLSDSRLPPSAWSNNVNANDLPYQPRQRHRRVPSSHHDYVVGSPMGMSFSSGAAIRSVATGGTPTPFPSISRSRSVISVEKDSGPITATGKKKGSIRLGTVTSKGTVGKSAGAAVEALSITAKGFFTPPSDGNRNR